MVVHWEADLLEDILTTEEEHTVHIMVAVHMVEIPIMVETLTMVEEVLIMDLTTKF